MLSRVQVYNINKLERENPHERIVNIGGFDLNGKRWKLSQGQAIGYIETGICSFYVTAGENTDDVMIGVHNGNNYLKTNPYGAGKDSLLGLPECP